MDLQFLLANVFSSVEVVLFITRAARKSCVVPWPLGLLGAFLITVYFWLNDFLALCISLSFFS